MKQLNGEVVGSCEIDGRTFNLLEINEHALPLVPLFVNETQTQDLNSTEIAWYHQVMIGELIERCQGGDRLALWAYQVIQRQNKELERAESVMCELKQSVTEILGEY